MELLAPAAGGCFHCGQPLAAQAVCDADNRHYCCQGCAAAAAWIHQAELGDYYRLRSELSATVDPTPLNLSLWDRPELQREHAQAIAGGLRLTLLTDGMRCAACAWLIDRALSRLPGVLDITANAITGRVRIDWDPAQITLSHILHHLLKLGYRPYLAAGLERERARVAERKRWLLRLGVAGLGAMQAMMLAEALYLDFDNQMPVATRDFFRWLTFVLATPVVFYSGWPFLAGMWNELRAKHIGMDSLIASSVLLAYLASLLETLRGGAHVWYDAAVMFVFLLLAARMLEQRARNAATAQVDALARARPAFATRECEDGSRESVPVGELRVDDVVWVAAGESAPADGVLLDANAQFEESLLTGESRPVHKQPGQGVYAGTHCQQSPARVRITCTGTQTRLSQLTRLVEHAQGHRPRIAHLADRTGRHFVVSLLVIAAIVWLGWHSYQPERAFEVVLSLLVISCPCALSLAVPTALASAHGALAKLGVLATTPNALDALAQATDMVFDKTGTLSTAQPQLSQSTVLDQRYDLDKIHAIAAALERDIHHPIAAAFAHADTGLPVVAAQLIQGQGIHAYIEGQSWKLGRREFAAANATAPEEDQWLWLGDGQQPVASFRLHESTRADALAALTALRQLDLRIHLSSGDAAEPVAAFAQHLSIDHAKSRQSPEQKLDTVRQLQQQGCVVAMVGDGLNDAPVLAGADVSIAMGEGASLAQRAADLVLTGPSLLRIPAAIGIARRTRQIVRQNLLWALVYNLLAIPLAAAGWVTPWVAALGMALSSLLVTLNALRLTRHKPINGPQTPHRR